MLQFANTLDGSSPKGWDAKTQPFLLEIGGEISPEISPTATSAAPKAYEYSWTLSHPGHKRLGGKPHWWDRDAADAHPIWTRLATETAARVYMYFPTTAGWRVQEIAATIKYLAPTRHHTTLGTHLQSALKAAGPMITDASAIAKLVPGGSAAAGWLDVVSKLQLQGVPSSTEFAWAVEKVAIPGHIPGADGLMDGLLFDVPRAMFELLGGRITGSVAVSFQQSADILSVGNVLAHACVYTDDDQDHWLPSAPEEQATNFISLPVHPRAPA